MEMNARLQKRQKRPAEFLAPSPNEKPRESVTKDAQMAQNTFISDVEGASLSGQLRHEQSCSYVDLLNEPKIENNVPLVADIPMVTSHQTEINQRQVLTSE